MVVIQTINQATAGLLIILEPHRIKKGGGEGTIIFVDLSYTFPALQSCFHFFSFQLKIVIVKCERLYSWHCVSLILSNWKYILSFYRPHYTGDALIQVYKKCAISPKSLRFYIWIKEDITTEKHSLGTLLLFIINIQTYTSNYLLQLHSHNPLKHVAHEGCF